MSNVNPLFFDRIQKALKRKRVLSDKERAKKASLRGGFDDSGIDKQAIKDIEKTFDTCFFCKQKTHAVVDSVHRTGKIIMSCNTPGCIGNYEEKESEKRRTDRKIYARLIDQKLCFDLAKMLIARDPSRLAVTPQRIVL